MNKSRISRNKGSKEVAGRAGDRGDVAGEVAAKAGPVAKKAMRSRWECPTCRARKILRRHRAP